MVPDLEASEPPAVADLTEARQRKQPSWKSRVIAELKSRPFGYTVLAIFLIAGPIAAPFLFPQAPPAAAIVGGLAFGVYAALSAVPQKFL